MTAMEERKPLEYYLQLGYPFQAIADEDSGGWVIVFPDLPGCMTQIDTLDERPYMANEARELWLETTYEIGQDIPLPSYPEAFSGKFNLRLPKSLHRQLSESAEREGVSLNQYVITVLARGDAQRQLECQLNAVREQLTAINLPSDERTIAR